MKYNYINGKFVRGDNRGRRINLNYTEASKVAELTEKGYSAEYITYSLELYNKKQDVVNFMRQYIGNNIVGFERSRIQKEVNSWNFFKKMHKYLEGVLND